MVRIVSLIRATSKTERGVPASGRRVVAHGGPLDLQGPPLDEETPGRVGLQPGG